VLDLRKLVVLREFASRGTVAKAAEALSFTPSAVSQQLSALQREAGVELLRLHGRKLELTDAGRLLVGEVDGLLAEHERVEAELEAASGEVRGTVRVAAFQTALRFLVMPIEVPGVRIDLYEEEAERALPMLLQGALDVVVAEEYDFAPRPLDPRIDRTYLEPDEMVLAGEGDDWATAREGTAYAEMLVRWCRSQGFEPNIRHRVNDMRLLLELVAAGRAVALLPMLGRPEGKIRRVGVSRSIFVATRASDRGRPSTAAVVEALSGSRRRSGSRSRSRAAATGRRGG
jgi:DNA-binding transcriptional LysR family regulator